MPGLRGFVKNSENISQRNVSEFNLALDLNLLAILGRIISGMGFETVLIQPLSLSVQSSGIPTCWHLELGLPVSYLPQSDWTKDTAAGGRKPSNMQLQSLFSITGSMAVLPHQDIKEQVYPVRSLMADPEREQLDLSRRPSILTYEKETPDEPASSGSETYVNTARFNGTSPLVGSYSQVVLTSDGNIGHVVKERILALVPGDQLEASVLKNAVQWLNPFLNSVLQLRMDPGSSPLKLLPLTVANENLPGEAIGFFQDNELAIEDQNVLRGKLLGLYRLFCGNSIAVTAPETIGESFAQLLLIMNYLNLKDYSRTHNIHIQPGDKGILDPVKCLRLREVDLRSAVMHSTQSEVYVNTEVWQRFVHLLTRAGIVVDRMQFYPKRMLFPNDGLPVHKRTTKPLGSVQV